MLRVGGAPSVTEEENFVPGAQARHHCICGANHSVQVLSRINQTVHQGGAIANASNSQ
jgi:hypothetical protein